MPIPHKLLQADLGRGFKVSNAILEQSHYKPTTLIIGVFLPNTKVEYSEFGNTKTPLNQYASAFMNLVSGNCETPPKISRKMANWCCESKATFADLVLNVQPDNLGNEFYSTDYLGYAKNTLNLFSGQTVKHKSMASPLQRLETIAETGEVDWNTQNIISYLKTQPTIQTIHFTRLPIGVWANHWQQITDK